MSWEQCQSLSSDKKPSLPKSTFIWLTSNPQIHVGFLRHRHLYLRSMSFFQILKSASNSQIYVLCQIFKSTSNDITDVCPNHNQQLGHISENLDTDVRILLYQTVIWDNDVSGSRFEEWTPIWVYHICTGIDIFLDIFKYQKYFKHQYNIKKL